MAITPVRIKDLPSGTALQSKMLAMDLTATERASIKDVVFAGRPSASQVEAEEGTNFESAMTPLTTKQSIAYEVGITIASKAQGDLADSAVQPSDIGSYFTPIFDTRSIASGTILSVFSSVVINRWDSGSNIFPSVYKKVSAEPTHQGKFQDAAGNWFELSSSPVNVDMFGAIGNGFSAVDGAITTGTSTFTSATGSFSAFSVGRSIVIKGAGVAGANLSTTISGYTNATTVTLTVPASTTVSGASWCYGTDDATAIKAAVAFVKATGAGELKLSGRKYLILSNVPLPSNTKVSGSGMGATRVIHPLSHSWKNDDTTNGNPNYTITDMTLSASFMFGGAVSMDGVQVLSCERLRIQDIVDRGITVGIGVSQIAGAFGTRAIKITDCYFDVPDYGVVVDSSLGNGPMKDITVKGCTFIIGWGSGVSISGDVKEAQIVGNRFFLTGVGPGTGTGGAGDPINDPNIGVGVKIWQGTSTTVCPESITISGNTFVGVSSKVDIEGVSVANYANNVSITGNTFDLMTYAVKNDFSNTANGLVVSSNTIKRSNYAVYNNNTSTYKPLISGNTVVDCQFGFFGSFQSGLISGNRMENITNDAIVLRSPSRLCSITGNNVDGVGECFVKMTGSESSGAQSLVLIHGNHVHNTGTTTNNTFDVLSLSNQSHVVTDNFLVSEVANKPRYIVGGSGTYRVVRDNWLYGASTGYYQTVAGGTDKFDNLERGLS
jgi:hypothetical protein